MSCNERLTILINPEVKGPKILQNFKNKETQRGCNWVSLRQKDCHLTLTSSWEETNIIEFDFYFHRHAAETGNIIEYNLQEAMKSHIVNYCRHNSAALQWTVLKPTTFARILQYPLHCFMYIKLYRKFKKKSLYAFIPGALIFNT